MRNSSIWWLTFIKYGSTDLIILYCCTYSRLLGTTGVVVQNSMGLMRTVGFGLMRNAGFGPWVDWNGV